MKKIIGLFFIIMMVAGCGLTPNPSVWTDDYIVSIEIAKENAIKIATISEFKTCFIRAVLGNHINQLPCEIVATLDEIDRLLEKIGIDYNLMTDCQKGQIIGLWTRLVTLGILEVVGEINPSAIAGLL